MRLLILPLILLVAFGCQSVDQDRKPNIIVIMTDDMGYAGPACYGGTVYKTPGIDRLATEGMSFTDFHSSGNVCSPTRAGLMTGRYQQRVGVEAVIHPADTHPENKKGLQKSELTFAEIFQEAGYKTGMVGKWHLGYAIENPTYHPMNHGFDSFYGFVSGNIDYISHWGDHLDHDWFHNRKETKEEGYTTHLINKYALKFIEENKNEPFCLYVAHEAPHSPVQGPGDPIVRGPERGERNTAFPKSKSKLEAYQYMMHIMDDGVKQIRNKIVELGLEKDTMIVFLSDNGDAPATKTGDPRYRGHKGSVYEGGHRVPAIFWYPGKVKANTKTDALSISLDIMPTILNTAGLKVPDSHNVDGIDLSSVILQKGDLPNRPLYWFSLSNRGQRDEAMRQEDWKLVVTHKGAQRGTFENEKVELYNLKNDQSEKNNLSQKHPVITKKMLTQLKAAKLDFFKTATPQKGGWLSPHNWKNDDFSKFLKRKAKEWDKMKK